MAVSPTILKGLRTKATEIMEEAMGCGCHTILNAKMACTGGHVEDVAVLLHKEIADWVGVLKATLPGVNIEEVLAKPDGVTVPNLGSGVEALGTLMGVDLVFQELWRSENGVQVDRVILLYPGMVVSCVPEVTRGRPPAGHRP